ncbi:MAG: ribosome-associated protein [Candidatus Azotimanducaceae bacterium]|jgi:ribosome-associated protein|tara:strand:+ start:263 stop:562 length:300 start_codon:yes stop_codon:yes gene_type:complete
MTTLPSTSNTSKSEQPPVGYRVVEISREPVELYKILKFEGLAESGGHAKAAIAAGEVHVNGKVELQKRKKIVTGDTIEIADEKISIQFVAPAETGEADL